MLNDLPIFSSSEQPCYERLGAMPMQSVRKNWLSRRCMATVFALAAAGLLSACAGPSTSISKGNTPQQLRAMAMWQERCKKSGEFIHRTVENVEGVYLVNVRTRFNVNHGEQPEDQFKLTDPYGHDSTDSEYVLNFLRGFYYREQPRPAGYPARIGYRYVEAFDLKDGQLYRYTGRVEEPWQHDKTYLKGYTRFVLDRVPITERTVRYGVKFEDISSREEREVWIAGSSLKVIDLQSHEVIAERIGYMVDWAQGSRAGQRSPWLFAAENACPQFGRHLSRLTQPASTEQGGQTLDFVEQVLKTDKREQ